MRGAIIDHIHLRYIHIITMLQLWAIICEIKSKGGGVLRGGTVGYHMLMQRAPPC